MADVCSDEMRQTLPLGFRVTATRVDPLDFADSTLNGTYWFDLRARRPVAASVKRAIDVIGAVTILTLTSPLLLALTLFRRDAIVMRRSIGFRGKIGRASGTARW